MTKSLFALVGAAALAGVIPASAIAQGAGAPPTVPIRPASRDAVIITNADFASAIAAHTPVPGAPATPGAGPNLSALGAVRGGDDRINVDVIKRIDAKAEGPVLHSMVTEIYYVIDGGGNFETGGTIPGAKPMATPTGAPVNPANIGPSLRGETIIGGTTRHLGVGDVVMIPPNVPHRFATLDGTVTYMVVRVNPGFEKGR